LSRPRKKVDIALVETLAGYGLTIDEIADAVRCGKSTLKSRFSAHLKKGWAELKTSLKRTQVAKALDGNVSMLIWLGKQYLGQSDRQQVDLTGEMDGRMVMAGAVSVAPAPTLTFAQALQMLNTMQVEMDPEKIKEAERLEQEGAAEIGIETEQQKNP
jgi:hypothetical protein